MTLTCDLGLESRLLSHVMCSAHCLTERNIWVTFNKNRPKGSGDMVWTQNSVTLTLSLGSWIMCSAHRLTKRKGIPINPLPLRSGELTT